jgi:ABC-type antimicrobial peptide transport system permease subunit
MFQNYCKTALRNLWRYKSYTLLNIVGLGISIAAIVWGYLNYKYSFSFDKFHPDIDHVYRGLTIQKDIDGVNGVFPMAAAVAAKNDFAGISDMVRFEPSRLNVKTAKDEVFSEVVNFTDPSFFKLFNFPLQSGNNDLNDKNAVLITEKTARKYFGIENPIGKTLLFYAGEKYAMPLTVEGVLKNPPLNSTMQFDFLTNFDNLLQGGKKVATDDWSNLIGSVYFKIPNPSDAPAISEGMKRYIPLQNNARQDWKVSGFKFITVRENAALREVVHSNYLFERPSDPAAYGPFVTAIFILLCACLNFSNTTVARSGRRLKEIGMRKVMGSTFRQLIIQMLLECMIIVLAAIILSALINMWWLPVNNEMFVYVDLHADYLHDTGLLAFLTVILVFTTLLAGSYPAFYISRFNPTNIFRGSIKFGGSNLFSRLMLGLQISISLVAVIGGIAFAKNAAFQSRYDFGFNIHNTIGIMVKDRNSFEALKNEIAKLPQVTGTAGTKNHIAFDYRHAVAEAEGIKKQTEYLEVGKNYLETMNLQMAAGRTFDNVLQSDYSNAILVTEKFAAMYGWKPSQALGKQVHIDTATYSVIGVLKDFHQGSLFEPTLPTVMTFAKEDSYHYLIIQAKTSDLTTVYAAAETAWKKLFPFQQFNAFYQDQMTAESYRVCSSIAKIFSWLAIVAVLLSATGLFALLSLTVIKRMREIAVRKVVGAKPRDIFLLINRGYFYIILAGIALGCYIGWLMVKSLLNQIFKINSGIGTSTVIVSIVVMLVIAFLTTVIRIWQAVNIKPVKLLRSE